MRETVHLRKAMPQTPPQVEDMTTDHVASRHPHFNEAKGLKGLAN